MRRVARGEVHERGRENDVNLHNGIVVVVVNSLLLLMAGCYYCFCFSTVAVHAFIAVLIVVYIIVIVGVVNVQCPALRSSFLPARSCWVMVHGQWMQFPDV